MLSYDHKEEVKKDIFEYLKENYMNDEIFDYIYKDGNEYFIEFNEHFTQKIIEEVQEDDYVTGNGGGSYVYDKATAKEYVLTDGIDILDNVRFDDLIGKETIADYFLDEDWQATDANIRWYCCFGAAEDAVNDFEEYLNEKASLMLEKIYVECGGCDNE